MSDTSPREQIRRFLKLIHEPGSVFEVRAPKCAKSAGSDFRRTMAGWFNNPDAAADAVAELDRTGRAPGIYVTMNPVKPDLIARAVNKLTFDAAHTTADTDIIRLRWLLVDLDPIRPAGMSSTEAEGTLALERSEAVMAELRGRGWPEPIRMMSGNGIQLWYRIDLDTADAPLVGLTLQALAARFTDDAVDLDVKVGNPARIAKIAGTVARKGENTVGIEGVEDRPHRRAKLLDVPESLEVCPRELLQAIVDEHGASTSTASNPLTDEGWAAKAHRKPAEAGDPTDAEKARAALKSLNITRADDYGNWIKVGAALHSVGDELLSDWAEWSRSSAKFSEGQCEAKWSSFKNDAGGARLGSLLHLAAEDQGCTIGELLAKHFPRPKGKSKGQAKDDKEEKDKRRAAQKILDAADEDMVLFWDPANDRGYATVRVNDHMETWPTKSQAFRRIVTGWLYEAEGSGPSEEALGEAINTFDARAICLGERAEVHIRLAQAEGAIWLDMVDEQWRVIRIDANGWEVVPGSDCPVKFIRRKGVLPLPEPVAGGELAELREFINCPDEGAWALLAGWLVMALNPSGPYPILLVNGEQGSAKSSLCRYLRSLVDPNLADVRSPPKEERDIVIAASNAWCVAYDNLSGIQPALSDALCRISTGAAFGTRQLYSDAEEALFKACRPILANGIDDLANRSDLLDRAVCLSLPKIPEDQRRDEHELAQAFQEARPRIFGALLTGVSTALKNRPTTTLARKPRMADFALWVNAAEPALGLEAGAFMAAYTANRDESSQASVEASPVGSALLRFMHTRLTWTGTSEELRRALNAAADEEHTRSRSWPQSARGLSAVLRRIAPNLRSVGLEIELPERTGRGGKRVLNLRNTPRSAANGDGLGDGGDGLPKSKSQPSPSGSVDKIHNGSGLHQEGDGGDGGDGLAGTSGGTLGRVDSRGIWRGSA